MIRMLVAGPRSVAWTSPDQRGLSIYNKTSWNNPPVIGRGDITPRNDVPQDSPSKKENQGVTKTPDMPSA